MDFLFFIYLLLYFNYSFWDNVIIIFSIECSIGLGGWGSAGGIHENCDTESFHSCDLRPSIQKLAVLANAVGHTMLFPCGVVEIDLSK